MSVYAVVSETPKPELRAAVEREFGDSHYHWSQTVSFVNASGTPKGIANKLGIKYRDSENVIHGGIDSAIVIKISPAYFGWSKATLWDWLKSSFEASD